MAHRSQVLKLYKNILKVHQLMPAEIRHFGDMYVRVEFRRHKDCDPKFIPTFMQEWEDYYKQTRSSLVEGSQPLGKDLTEDIVENHLDDRQLEQLLDLAKETRKGNYQYMVVEEDDDRVPTVVGGCGSSSGSSSKNDDRTIKRPGDYK